MSNEHTDQGRRGFLGTAAATVAGLTAAPGLSWVTLAQARPADQPASDKVRWGLLIDTSKCGTDCQACVTACNQENGLVGHNRPQTDAQWLRKVELRNKATGRQVSLPMGCQHCEKPPCVDVCPTGASFKRVDGIVLVDRHICIGCRYCMMACPYKARSFVHEETHDQKSSTPRGMGTVEGCNLCVSRIDAGKLPACVEACHKEGHKAITFGDLKDPASEIAQRLAKEPSSGLREELRLNTGVRFQGV